MMMTASEMKVHLITKAGDDDGFRARRLADPTSVIEQKMDMAMPEGFSVEVHEESTPLPIWYCRPRAG